METILIVDDEKNYLRILSAVLEEEGFEALTADNGRDALEILGHSEVDLVLTDMKMSQMDGIALLEQIKQQDPDLPVILMTAHGTVDKAVEAMQKGAYTYLTKPFANEKMVLYARKAVATYQVVKENRRLRTVVESQYSFGNIIGKSKVMQDVYETIRKVAPTNASVLIEGESGTGKELVAKAIHFNSFRRQKPFLAVNCSAFAENLLETELFGHEKGAFTGAVATKKGRLELADGGTLFLDEIGELPAKLQVKLLRVLQEKAIERVGGLKSISVNFRLIAATNKELNREMATHSFRKDLYYRLNVVHITLPPLRQRPEDLHLLIEHFIKKFSADRHSDIPVTGIDQEAERLIYGHHWPGNVRELENVIEQAMILCPDSIIRPTDLPKHIQTGQPSSLNIQEIPYDANLSETLAMVEVKMIQRALELSNNVQAHAARLLGIGKSGLNQKLKKHKLRMGSKN